MCISGDAFIDDMIATADAMVNGAATNDPRSTQMEDTIALVRGPYESTLGTVQRLVRIHQAMMSDDRPAIFDGATDDSAVFALRQWLVRVGLGCEVKAPPPMLLTWCDDTNDDAKVSSNP